MTELNAVVIFYSRHGRTESLALEAGVGVIQARGNVRFRRITDAQNADGEYIAPREIDLEWADMLVLAIPSDAPDAMNRYLGSLKDLTGKIAAPFTWPVIMHGEKDAALMALYAAAARAGLMVIPAPVETAADPIQTVRAHARRVAEIARVLKTHRAASNSAAAP